MAKKVVRIHFMDEQCKAFAIEESTTAEQLKATIIEKIELKEDGCFALFEKKDGWERCLEPEEKPCELMAMWTETTKAPKSKEGKETLKDAACAFIFKKKIFLRDEEGNDQELKDPVARHLVYIQAVYNVIESEYPCSNEDAVRLAALQVQVVYGDHKSGTHQSGFLTDKLRDYIPKELYSSKKSSEWENLIFKAHAQLVGKSADDAKLDYLNIVKQWPFYGTTFFPPCKSAGKQKTPSKVIVGVNAEGILLLKKDKELVSSHPFTEICSWASSSTTFAFEFGNQTESQKYTFETKQGSIIAANIQTYIDILVQMLKNNNGDDDDEEDA